MAYQVLARKYRPLLFSDVVGQDHVTRTLLNALAQGRIAHGYIFSGHRGIGKTTIARILAAALNCMTPVGSPERPTQEPCRVCVNCREISAASRQESSIFEEAHSFDVEEIDAATNRGIDDARLLTTKIQARPTNKSKYRIIILDEAHQITDAAWNALLKTLEEPPDWAVFMFATTQPEDIPQTIRSRCQHFSFHAVKLDDIVGQLRTVSTKENIEIDDAALALLAEAGDGSMRDALSIMDQAIASAPVDASGRPSITIEQVRELMGSVSNVVFEQILEAVHANSSADVLNTINRLLDAGNGPQQLARQFVRFLRNCTVAKVTGLSPDADATGAAADLLQISAEERRRAARSAALFTEEELSRFLSIMLRTFDELGYRQEQRFHLELGLLKLVHVQRLVPVEELLSQLGAPTPRPSGASSPPSAPRPAITSAAAPARNSAPAQPVSSKTASFSAPSAESNAPRAAAAPIDNIGRASTIAADTTRRSPVASAEAMGVAETSGALALASAPVTMPAERPQLVPASTPAGAGPSSADAIGAVINGLAASSSETANGNLSALQSACVSALEAAKGQSSASHAVEEATFKLAGDQLEIQTTASKAMLPALINAEAERILSATVRTHNPSLKLKLLPGTPTAASTRKPRAAAAGSVQDLAAKHPLVLQAQQLFGAEISNVIDLRKDS